MSAIIACIWQGLAIAWLTALLLRLTSRLNAATRHAIWWLALGQCAGAPVRALRGVDDRPARTRAGRPPSTPTRPALLLPAPPDWLIACLAGAWLGIVLLAFARLVHAVGLVADRQTALAPRRRSDPTLAAAVDRGQRHRPRRRVAGLDTNCRAHARSD